MLFEHQALRGRTAEAPLGSPDAEPSDREMRQDSAQANTLAVMS
jgi:hypothetical protein